VGGVAAKPTRASGAEGVLLGKRIDGERIQESALKAAEELDPIPDPRATSAVKRKLVARLTNQTLNAAFKRAHGAA